MEPNPATETSKPAKPRRRLGVVVLCVLVVGVALALWLGEKEPEYQGKKLSEWLRDYRQPIGAMAPVISNEAADAVRHIGTNGVPFLVKWIRESPMPSRSRLWDRAYGWNLNSRLRSAVLEAVASRELRSGRAFWGFKILGPDARAAIPDLVQVAKEGKQWSAPAATTALGYLGKDALPPLLALATNRGFQFRGEAMVAIGQMHYLGTNAHSAVVLLIECLEVPDFAPGAADILGRLGLESDISVPALAGCIQSTNQSLRLFALISLGKFGEQARGAASELLKALDDPEAIVREAGTNALLKIAPEVLKTNGGAHSGAGER